MGIAIALALLALALGSRDDSSPPPTSSAPTGIAGPTGGAGFTPQELVIVNGAGVAACGRVVADLAAGPGGHTHYVMARRALAGMIDYAESKGGFYPLQIAGVKGVDAHGHVLNIKLWELRWLANIGSIVIEETGGAVDGFNNHTGQIAWSDRWYGDGHKHRATLSCSGVKGD